jgi:hypothetical protein
MYIRWVIRKHKNLNAAYVSFHDAYLVESFRDEDDAPRQRIINYLGNIRQFGEHFPAIERELFLLRARRILAQTPDISHAEQKDILHQLHLKVPPLTYEEVEQAFHQNLHWYRQWCHQANKPLPTIDEIQHILGIPPDNTDNTESEL